MICDAYIFVIANDEEKRVECHSISGHGLGHVFDAGEIPHDASVVIIKGQYKDEPINPRDIIVKWTPIVGIIREGR